MAQNNEHVASACRMAIKYLQDVVRKAERGQEFDDDLVSARKLIRPRLTPAKQYAFLRDIGAKYGFELTEEQFESLMAQDGKYTLAEMARKAKEGTDDTE